MSFKKKMTNVYIKQVEDLENMLPNFRVASAILHYDETSTHMHIVGVPIKHKNKNGMSKQVGKSDVFTKESLKSLQDKMRTLCIESFNKEYNLTTTLKQKLKGRNKDYHIFDMANYQLMKNELEKNKTNLEKANKKSLELESNSKDIKLKIDGLKQTILNKEHYILTKDDKDTLTNFIDNVDKTNKEYKNINNLSVTLTNVSDELKSNRKEIKSLTENNNVLSSRIEKISKKLISQDKYIGELEEENSSLKNALLFWQDKFNKVINFIKDKLFSKKDQDKYYDVSRDLYNHGIIKEDVFDDLKYTYDYSKKRNNKEKDDFER